MTSYEAVTIYIPCYNAEKYISRCLEGVLSQTYPVKEVLVIDDGSTDGSHELISRYPVKIIRHETNKGLAAARNTAIKNATTGYLACVDSDVVPEPDWLEKLMLNFSDKVAGVGGKLLELYSVFLPDQWRANHAVQHWGDAKRENPDFIHGANNVYRKEALVRAGLYNEKYRTNGEDCDMSFTLLNMGYTLVYEPLAIARHLRQDTLQSVLNTYWHYHTPFHIDTDRYGSYMNLKKLLHKIHLNFKIGEREINKDFSRKRYHLLYPSFLFPLRNTLQDIRLCTKLHSPDEDKHQIERTFVAVYLGIFALLKATHAPQNLVNTIIEDVADLRLSKPEIDVYLSDTNVRNMAVNQTSGSRNVFFPAEDFDKDFARQTLGIIQKWLNEMNETVYQMITVSGERVRDELRQKANIIKKTKVMLLNPPWREGNRAGVRAGSRWPFTMEIGNEPSPVYLPFPFFLAYATAMLKKDRFEAVLVDAVAEGLTDEEFLERVRGFSPDIILIETATASIKVDLQYTQRIIHELKQGIKVIFAGTHVSALGEDFLRENGEIDAIILGEYENIFLEIVKRLDGNKSLRGIENVIYRTSDGKINVNARSNKLIELDTLPWPERDTLPMYAYYDQFANSMPSPNVQIHASRGCPYGCIYCVWPQVLYGSQKYRTRNPIDVVDEIEWLIKKYGFKAFYFDDDTFNIGKERILKLCSELKKRGLHKIPWTAMCRADTSDRETFLAMKEAGMVGLKFGVESGVQRLVDASGKNLDLSKVKDAVRICKEIGLKTHLTFTLGLPGETLETIKGSIEFAKMLDPDTVQWSLTTPFPGTKYFDLANKNGWLSTKDWAKYDGAMYTVLRSDNLSIEELQLALQATNTQWREYVISRQCKV
ncbi:MAG: glycosyltransferase [Candidatus Brocadia sp.]|nr:glycosyltransferase [Candidatus Brocadia sp.]